MSSPARCDAPTRRRDAGIVWHDGGVTMEVRLACHTDRDAIADTHIAGWRVAYRGIFPDEYLDDPAFDAERRQNWHDADWETRPPDHVHVVVLDGRVVGFGAVGPERTEDRSPSGRGELYTFYVHPDAWGSGVATPLIRACEQRLREMGFAEAMLVVLRDNPRARRFYEKAGWSCTGEVTLWDGPTMPGVPKPPPVADVEYTREL